MATFKLTKKDIANVYLRCLNLIRRKPIDFVVFKKLSICGWCKYDEDILEIDYRKDLLRTAYHECIHYIYPDWSETMVLYAESRVINNVSVFDNVRFLKYLTAKIYKSALHENLSKHRQKRAKKKNKNVSRNTRRTNKG
jgi:hypothetical protein